MLSQDFFLNKIDNLKKNHKYFNFYSQNIIWEDTDPSRFPSDHATGFTRNREIIRVYYFYLDVDPKIYQEKEMV